MLEKNIISSYPKSASEGAANTYRLPNHQRHWRAQMAKEQLTPQWGPPQVSEAEIWKPVPSEPGVLASSLGRVLQAPCFAPLPNGGYRAYMPKPRFGEVAKSRRDAAHEYRHILLRRHGDGPRQQPRKVHQLVCEALHGPKPFPEAVVIHIDEDAHNNRPENMKWGTQKENLNAPKLRASIRKRAVSLTCPTCACDFEPCEVRQIYCSRSCSALRREAEKREVRL